MATGQKAREIWAPAFIAQTLGLGLLGVTLHTKMWQRSPKGPLRPLEVLPKTATTCVIV